MNIEGISLLEKFGFSPPFQSRVLKYDEVSKIDLNKLYSGARCGASIQAAPKYMKLSHGPNLLDRTRGEHNIPQYQFFEAFDKVVSKAREKGFAPSQLLFAICQSVPPSVTISGICARVDDNGFGYLACEVLNGVRSGDFTPDYSIQDSIVGGRPMGHTRKITGNVQSFPLWAVNQMYKIMKRVNSFNEGIVGVEFVLDTQLQRPIFHDLYWSLKPDLEISQKFHLRNGPSQE